MKIDNNINNNPSFNGQVSPKVVNAVDKVAKISNDYVIGRANKGTVQADSIVLDIISRFKNDILSNFESAMKKFHKDTVLDIDGGDFRFVNKTVGSQVKTVPMGDEIENYFLENNVLYTTSKVEKSKSEQKAFSALVDMFAFSNNLRSRVNPYEIDSSMYFEALNRLKTQVQGANWVEKLVTNHKISRLEQLAEEFGITKTKTK